VYFDPITPEHDLEINKIFKSLASEDPSDPPIRNRKLSTWGRTLLVPESTSKVAKFDFEELCGQPLSAADYLEVTKNFGTVFLLNVPKMGLSQKDLVRCPFFLNNLESFSNGRNCRQGDSSPSLTVRVKIIHFSHIKNFLLD
jgi:predicted ATPase